MIEQITLSEYQTTICALSDEDAQFIAGELGKQISIQRRMDGSQFDLNPNQFVGVVALPSGRNLLSKPKVPIQNLFLMLAIAYDLDDHFREEVTKLAQFDELLDFVVLHFLNLIEERMSRGLYRNYVEFEENLGFVRGRIMIARDIQHNAALRHRTFCQYSEFTHDIPENQIIRQVVHHLNGWVRRPSTRFRLLQMDALLGEVTATNYPVSILDRMRYHRLNDDYEPIHKLCRLFLEGASVQETQDAIDFKTFLIDMNVLFEKFVAQTLLDYLPADILMTSQARNHLDVGQQVNIDVDLLLTKFGQPILIADTKYKRLFDSKSANADLYQVLAYCVAMNARTGALIYPVHEVVALGHYTIRNSPVTIHRILIDLNVPLDQFDSECKRFATKVAALTG